MNQSKTSVTTCRSRRSIRRWKKKSCPRRLVHGRLVTFTDPEEQPYRGTLTIATGESGPTGNPVTQPLDRYLDEEMKARYVLISMGFVPDSKDLCVVTEYHPDKGERAAGVHV